MSVKTTFEEMSNVELNYHVGARLGYKGLVATKYANSGWTYMKQDRHIPYIKERMPLPDFTSGHMPFVYHLCDEMRKRFNVESAVRWDTENRSWTCLLYTDEIDLSVTDESLGRAVVRAFLEYDDAVSSSV